MKHPAINRAISIDGWMSIQELQWLAETASQCINIVEFGCHKGRSTRALADNCLGKVFAIDPWSNTHYLDDDSAVEVGDNFPEFYENLKDLILANRVIPIRGYSKDFYTEELIDFVFIDGDHRYEQVKLDINIARSLRPMVIAGHDYTHDTWPGVKKAVDEEFRQIGQVKSIWYVRL